MTGTTLGVSEGVPKILEKAPSSRRLSNEQRYTQLLDVAEQVFAEQGFHTTTVQEIVQVADVSRPILYNHFGSKEGLLVELVKRARAELNANISATFSESENSADNYELWLGFGTAYLDQLEKYPDRWTVVYSMPLVGNDPLASQMRELRNHTVEQVRQVLQTRLVQKDVSAEKVEAIAHAISGTGEQLGQWALADLPNRRSDYAWAYVNFIQHGVSVLSGDSGLPDDSSSK